MKLNLASVFVCCLLTALITSGWWAIGTGLTTIKHPTFVSGPTVLLSVEMLVIFIILILKDIIDED